MKEREESWVQSWIGKLPWKRAWQPIPSEEPGRLWSMGVTKSRTRLKWLSTHTHTHTHTHTGRFTYKMLNNFPRSPWSHWLSQLVKSGSLSPEHSFLSLMLLCLLDRTFLLLFYYLIFTAILCEMQRSYDNYLIILLRKVRLGFTQCTQLLSARGGVT